MIRATISEVKDGMSACLRRVKSGGSVLVMERRTPVARAAALAVAEDDPPGVGFVCFDARLNQAASRVGFAILAP